MLESACSIHTPVTAARPICIYICYFATGQILFTRLGDVANGVGMGVAFDVGASTEVIMGLVLQKTAALILRLTGSNWCLLRMCML